MRRIRIPRLRFYQLLIPAAVAAFIVGVACGGAEQTAPAASTTGDSGGAAPAATSPPAAAVGATATPLPTQVPQVMADTGEGRRLVVLTESFGNEVWDPKFESGDKHLWHFPLHSHLMTTDDELA
ncbi:MAG: hypothetical protein OXH30_08650, partial [Chloroflexi bacterium]|nr:hypothetical protein [Chloroflexota bacterium]